MLFFAAGFDFFGFEVGAGTRGTRAAMPSPTNGSRDRIERARSVLGLFTMALFAVEPGPPGFVGGIGSLGILGQGREGPDTTQKESAA